MEDLIYTIWDEFHESKIYHNMENLEDVFGNILKFDIDYDMYSFYVKLFTSKGIILSYNTYHSKDYFECCKVLSYDWSDHIYNLRHGTTVDHVRISAMEGQEESGSEVVISLELDDPRRSLEYVKSEFYRMKSVHDQMQSLFGRILKSEITGYYKYSFEITLTTEIGVLLIYCTNGNPDEIYFFHPKSICWFYHESKIENSPYVIEFKEMEISEVLLK